MLKSSRALTASIFFQGQVAQEYDVIKDITQTLAMFKGENHDSRQVGQGLRSSFASFEEPTRDPDVWPAPPPRDPDVWSGPTHASQPEPGRVRPVRGPKKPDAPAPNKSGRASRTSAAAAGGKYRLKYISLPSAIHSSIKRKYRSWTWTLPKCFVFLLVHFY